MMMAKRIRSSDVRMAPVSSASVGFALLATAANAVILTHLLPTHGFLGFVGASLCVICTYFWWTVTATRSGSLRGFEDVAKLFTALISCEVAVGVVGRLLAVSAEGVWGYLSAALLLMPFPNGLVNLTLLPGLLLALTVSVGRLVFVQSGLPLSAVARACTALALGFLTTTATWLIVKREEKMETIINVDSSSATEEVIDPPSKFSIKRRRFSAFTSHRGKGTVSRRSYIVCQWNVRMSRRV